MIVERGEDISRNDIMHVTCPGHGVNFPTHILVPHLADHLADEIVFHGNQQIGF